MNYFSDSIVLKTLFQPKNRVFEILAALTVIGIGFKVLSSVRTRLKRRKRIQKSLQKKDVIILHQFPRGYLTPSVSPFPLKLETYLRMTKIPYENDFEDYMGPKQKCPYITLNGEDIADSQLIIEFLNKKHDINLNEGLNAEQEALAHALRILAENSLYWTVVLQRWVYDKGETILKIWGLPEASKRGLASRTERRIRTSSWCQGYGRHSVKEVEKIAQDDLRSLSVILGNKKYFLGDKPHEVDCALFGMLAQLVWNFPNTFLEQLATEEYSNLKSFCLRMKDEFWPDWDNCLHKN